MGRIVRSSVCAVKNAVQLQENAVQTYIAIR